jgi:hypothetical protein
MDCDEHMQLAILLRNCREGHGLDRLLNWAGDAGEQLAGRH